MPIIIGVDYDMKDDITMICLPAQGSVNDNL